MKRFFDPRWLIIEFDGVETARLVRPYAKLRAFIKFSYMIKEQKW